MAKSYFERCAAAGLNLPLAVRAEQPGVIYDASGNGLITVDVDNEMPDVEAEAIARLICQAVNAVGGWATAKIEEAGRMPRTPPEPPPRCR